MHRRFALALLTAAAALMSAANLAYSATTPASASPAVAVGPQYDTTHVYVAPADVDAFDRPCIRRAQPVEAQYERSRYFDRIGYQRGQRLDRADHRRDHIVRSSRVHVVEAAENVDVPRWDAELLVRFAKCRRNNVDISFFDRPARKADLAFVIGNV